MKFGTSLIPPMHLSVNLTNMDEIVMLGHVKNDNYHDDDLIGISDNVGPIICNQVLKISLLVGL